MTTDKRLIFIIRVRYRVQTLQEYRTEARVDEGTRQRGYIVAFSGEKKSTSDSPLMMMR